MYDKEENEGIIIGHIIAKRIQGLQLSGSEAESIKNWLAESPENREMYERCTDKQEQAASYTYLSSIDVPAAFARFEKNRLAGKSIKKTPMQARLAAYLLAASVLLVGLFGLYTLYFNSSEEAPIEKTVARVDYAPARNKATVTLSDGRVFNLDEVQNEIYMDDSGINYRDGSIVAETKSVTSMEVTTPRGGLYNLTLPDGTRVKLNAGSTLNYPTKFKEHSREVQLNGEAYFEVAQQHERPFTVRTSDQIITVLGTHFNVAAYVGPSPTKTTLTEGKVRVKETINQAELILEPGQQALLQEGRLSKREVNIDQELAWIQGKFNFDRKSLREVMDDLSRWYNVDVVYKGKVPDIQFFGGTFRSSKLSTILSILESKEVQYRMTEDNKLIISGK
ncbi:FecR family protein [Sphingobacterium arenae]|uniref:FecR domain-containing protein n=1 Tax=Sphingobacterium arenae TaxID=1280598 RepID=A0ABR7Y6U6_9SPHI|nr:FecR domain-containing protein [Sphingobacterium arenae]MBD1426989.1 FecR domain-containing protein [Sphingobacterium arenae]